MNSLNEYLNNIFEISKLPSWIISSSDLDKTLYDLKDFISSKLMSSFLPLDKNPDFYLIERLDAAKDISIDQIRVLQEALNQTSGIGSSRVAIIYEADLMNLYAANSCLKILEEPKESSYIFLLTKRPSSLIQTIRSRCAYFNVTKINEFTPENTEYQNFVESISDINIEKNLLVIKELKSKDRELWLKLSDYSFNLLSRITKKITLGIELIPCEIEVMNRLHKNSMGYFIKKFDNLIKLTKNTQKYDLDLTASYILLLEEFRK